MARERDLRCWNRDAGECHLGWSGHGDFPGRNGTPTHLPSDPGLSRLQLGPVLRVLFLASKSDYGFAGKAKIGQRPEACTSFSIFVFP